MTRYMPLDPERHKMAGFQKSEGFGHAARDWTAPVMVEELPQIIPFLPLAFVPLDDAFQLVALQSFEKGKNVVIRPADGRWLTPYVPAVYRGYPFARLQMEGENEPVLCIDEESPLYRTFQGPDDIPFFDGSGKPVEIVERVIQFLTLYEDQRKATHNAVFSLAKQGVIVPWEIRIQAGEDQETRFVEGLYKIDESRLNTLSLAAFETLRRAGALPVAYAQLFSQHRLNVLARLHHAHVQPEQMPDSPADIDKLFGDDDKFRF